ncbi:MAG: hypothetical protein KA109_10085 [Saprospiraceae bacterium]|jgi:hypothetical protein|nr:hypothetical protein [Saprospiraceae bacterium]MBK6477549.1 hypothetical protein [Saprospiraceae bacterium]MBK6816578.1 hypothetical protein [Saprospiraceae bacterium]MBK7371104.1 hypothetical protein [Saprospiraceae bacterium]MBK7436396.1 hypothetical protein [Saprospiraceae bacterium]
MKSITIKGEVQYISLATGFWAIISDKGEKYRPVNMPDQLKTEGKKVICKAKPVEEEISLFMWGTPVKITVFET